MIQFDIEERAIDDQNKLKTCIKNNYNYIYEKYIHLYFIILFEILFYFNYIVNVENIDIIKILNSFGNYINNIGIPWSNIIPISEKTAIQTMCNGIQNNLVSEGNTKLEQDCIILLWILCIFWTVLTTIHYTLYKSTRMIMVHILKSCIFICFIGVFEYYFFITIVKNYETISNEESTCILLTNII